MLNMRSNLADDFARLGLSEYLTRFIEEGFTDWSSIADITESDLAALGVKLGHRRTLYREIATLRGYPQSERLEDIPKPVPGSLPSSVNEENRSPCDVSASGSDGQPSPASYVDAVPQKRRYKRHPKPDDNAPTRPPSAYVLFANVIREEQKDTNLSFTQLARLVGERWKNLAAAEKETIESQAAEVKRRYTAEVGVYKKSPEYHQYQAYLREFKQRVLKDERPEKLEPPRKAMRTMNPHSPAAHTMVLPNSRDHGDLPSTRNEHEHDPRSTRQGSGAPFTIPSILQDGPRRGDERVLPSLDYVYNFGTQDQYNSLNEKACLPVYAARPILPRPEFPGPMDNILPTAMYNKGPQWNEEVRRRSLPTERPSSTNECRPSAVPCGQGLQNDSYVNR